MLQRSTAIVKVPVEANISNPELSVEMISDETGDEYNALYKSRSRYHIFLRRASSRSTVQKKHLCHLKKNISKIIYESGFLIGPILKWFKSEFGVSPNECSRRKQT